MNTFEQEKRYVKQSYEQERCPRCSQSWVYNFDCKLCGGTGKIMGENSRSQESAYQNRKEDDDKQVKAWLFA
jgi:hypothetical protein